MELLIALYTNQLLVFVLVLSRVSGLVILAPIWGSRAMPPQIRAFLAIGISMVVAPLMWHTPIENPGNLVNLLVLVGCEFAVGLSLGLAVTIFFAGLQIAGQIAGQMSGMSLADVVSPSLNSSIPVFAQFLHLLMLSIFVLTGGHRAVLEAMLQVFHDMPPGQTHFSMPLLEGLTEITSFSFRLGLQISMPVMVALMLSILIMGLISRTLPQLNVLAVGFSVNSMVMLSALLLSIGVLSRVFHEQGFVAIDMIRNVYANPPPP